MSSYDHYPIGKTEAGGDVCLSFPSLLTALLPGLHPPYVKLANGLELAITAQMLYPAQSFTKLYLIRA